MTGVRSGVFLAVMLMVPPAAATTWGLAVAAAERSGARVFGTAPFRNSAEAAAAGDAATMLLLLRLGENPTWVHQVRPELISAAMVRVTTLEAALWSKNISMIRALDRAGAIVGDDQRHELACLARDLDLPETAEYLARGATCAAGDAIKRVEARSARPESDDE